MHAAGAERAVAALAASQHSAFGRRQAASLGMSAKMIATRLRSGVLSEPMPGVFVFVAAPKTWRQQLIIPTLAAPGGVPSFRAAGALHELDGLELGLLDVSVPSSRHLRAPGYVIHRVAALDACAVTKVDGVPCTNIARTLCDLGAVVSQDRVEQALDDALRRGVSERWIRETLSRVDRPGPSGTATLRRIFDLPDRSGALPDSWFERLVERLLANSVLPPPVRQHKVCETGGSRVAFLDLAWPEVCIAVEPSGARFHSGDRNRRRDHARDFWLAAEGWEVLYALWSDQHDPERFSRSVEKVHLRRLRVGSGDGAATLRHR
jgi:very-short-patch-repair endonuclease